MGQITEDFIQRAMRCCQLGQHPYLTVWETRQLLTAWVEWQGCRDERDKLDEANRICEQWRQWTVATRAENEALRARVAEEEQAHSVTIDERDQYHEMADKLAGAIAAHFGEDIGEHSNLNCPWTQALELIENRAAGNKGESRDGT